MDATVRFQYQGREYRCQAFIDLSETPYYIFVVFDSPELINAFGAEITIKTDLKSVLPRNNDYQELVEISHCIFHAMQDMNLFYNLQPNTARPTNRNRSFR